MKVLIDVICARCCNAESSHGIDPEDAIANFHCWLAGKDVHATVYATGADVTAALRKETPW